VTYFGLIKTLVVPDGFQPPQELVFGEVCATPIGRSDLSDDVAGINASLDIIRQTRGGRWPTEPVTAEGNYLDLVWHEAEQRDASSYTYVLRDPSGRYLGCFYLYPLGRRQPLSAELMEHDVDVSWWVTETAHAEGYYPKVYEALREWSVRSFPFENPYFSNVDIPGGVGSEAVDDGSNGGSGDLPLGLLWEIEPASVHVHDGAVVVEAAGRTDNFIDPAGAVTVLNGARAHGVAPATPWQFSACVVADLPAAYDAGALVLWSDDHHFAKLCLERSADGRMMVVSVVTREMSDDANAWPIEGDKVWLRIGGLANHAYAFHSSSDGTHWDLVRYFHLVGKRRMKYGISVQSPIGDGCSVSFEELSFVSHPLSDLRDGS
jgi:regulation of enolase protein 1 (concanavalin A-like superfamily)